MFVTDHDFQTALTEALCRITPPDQRKGVADRLFPMEHVASAFVKLRDSEFETVHCFATSLIRCKMTLHWTFNHYDICIVCTCMYSTFTPKSIILLQKQR